MIKQLSKTQFDELTRGKRREWESGVEEEMWCGQEQEWYSACNDTVYGIVTQDTFEHSFSFFILTDLMATGLTHFHKYYESKGEARAALLQILEDTYDPDPERRFP